MKEIYDDKFEHEMRMHAKQIANLMYQLSNENRLLILCTLLDGPKTVGDIAEKVHGITAPALSQHLHKLRDANLVCTKKYAQFVQYSICDPRIVELIQLLKKQFCKVEE